MQPQHKTITDGCKPLLQVASRVQQHLKTLLGLLREAKQGAQNSVLTLTAVHAAEQIVTARPGQAGRILPSLLALAAADLPAVAKQSIHKRLRTGLLGFNAADTPSLKAWKPKVRLPEGSAG